MPVAIRGSVDPAYEAVRRAFVRNFRRSREVGAALCVYRNGARVVDLWAGWADVAAKRPWTPETIAVVFSSTKGLVATCFAMLVDRGQLELDAPVAEYWPGFARNGKERITVRQLLNHRSGLPAVDVRLTLEDLGDRARLVDVLEAQRPLWTPGSDQGYGATAWGMYAGELFHRVADCSVGRFLSDQVARPLGADVHLGLKPAYEERVARLITPGRSTVAGRILPTALTRRTSDGRMLRRLLFDRDSVPRKALGNPHMGPERLGAMNDPRWWRVEMPWMNGVASARGLARVYAALAQGGSLDGVRLLRSKTLQPLQHRQTWSERDRTLQKPIGFAQGFTKDELRLFSPHAEAFGHTGAGGSVGFADPRTGLAVGYVMNRLDWRIRSPRSIRLCRAIYTCL